MTLQTGEPLVTRSWSNALLTPRARSARGTPRGLLQDIRNVLRVILLLLLRDKYIKREILE